MSAAVGASFSSHYPKSFPREITKVKKSLYGATVLILLLAFVSAMAFGQAETGMVAGTAQDPTGAVIPNATVTLTNTGTGATRTAKTGPNGEYTITNLQPGMYSVSVTAPAFAKGL